MSNTRISEEQLNQIRNAVDIVDLVSEYVQLKKQGRNYFGLCPFHGENSPSFSVAPEKQIFHCFGCGAGGNIFTFLMDIEGLSFLEAAKKLSEKANVPLDIVLNQSDSSQQDSSPFYKMMEAHELLRKFYHHLLVNTKEGENALEYLLQRGFTEEAIEKFQLGYSLGSWDFVYKFLTKRGFDESLLEESGLIIKSDREGKYFDRFRNRIMFPIFDTKGNTIAFSGRSLGDDEPKYLNSPETPIFHKSNILYNFHLARSQIRKKERAVLMEGFADTITASMAGVENVIATMGTALTDDHLALLKRNTNEILICYDSDSAGIEAANKAAKTIIESGMNVTIAVMPDGLDPDDYIKKYGAQSFAQEVIGNSLTYIAFKMKYLRRGKNLNNEGDRLSYIQEVQKEIVKIKNEVEREHYLRQLSTEFTLSLDSLLQQQKKIFFSERKKGNIAVANTVDIQTQAPLQYEHKLKPAYMKAERLLIAHMLQSKDTFFKISNLLQGIDLNIDEHQAIIAYIYAYYEKYENPDASLLMNTIPDVDLRRILSEIEMMSVNDEVTDRELNDYINSVLKYKKMLIIKEKEAERDEAIKKGDYLKAASIANEILKL
ncbi:DNA primase [Peribacillus alkalitolerans]|uniref:DNA primase n=1 Tax=Peribacillus alkalitolerans TaxID=1550385 RepID=UPI0013D5A11D|nr:DNA primase [Peribacillus alkalitolerans]